MRNRTSIRLPSQVRGFSLLEMAIVLVVLGVLARATLVPLAAMEASRKHARMTNEVQIVRDALVAELIAQGALPCPVSSDDSTVCPLRGGVPSQRLALNIASDAQGAALDPWGRPYMYALADTDTIDTGALGLPDWAQASDIVSSGISNLRGSLTICREARSPCGSSDTLANDLVFVVVSHGADASAADLQGLNQASEGSTFTKAPESSVAGHRFDDALVWLSRSEAVWWLLRAHRLP